MREFNQTFQYKQDESLPRLSGCGQSEYRDAEKEYLEGRIKNTSYRQLNDESQINLDRIEER